MFIFRSFAKFGAMIKEEDFLHRSIFAFSGISLPPPPDLG